MPARTQATARDDIAFTKRLQSGSVRTSILHPRKALRQRLGPPPRADGDLHACGSLSAAYQDANAPVADIAGRKSNFPAPTRANLVPDMMHPRILPVLALALTASTLSAQQASLPLRQSKLD